MPSIKIQKISNGHFCTAREFVEDFVESMGNNYYRFPAIDTRIDTADVTMEKMTAMKPKYLTRMKIFIDCELLNSRHVSGGTNENLPEVRPYYDNGRLSCYYHLPTLSMEWIEKEIDAVISRQQEICSRYNATEIEA